MKFLTNKHKDEVDAFVAEIQAQNPNRVYAKKNPRASAVYTSDQLRDMGMVGVYRVDKS